MQQTHTHKAVAGRVEATNLLSRRRQSDYSINCLLTLKSKQALRNNLLCEFSEASTENHSAGLTSFIESLLLMFIFKLRDAAMPDNIQVPDKINHDYLITGMTGKKLPIGAPSSKINLMSGMARLYLWLQ